MAVKSKPCGYEHPHDPHFVDSRKNGWSKMCPGWSARSPRTRPPLVCDCTAGETCESCHLDHLEGF